MRRRVVFPESGDARTIEAVTRIAELGIATPVLVVQGSFSGRNRLPSLVEVVSCGDDAPLRFAHFMVAGGQADACVAGAVHTTAQVLRSAFRTIGTASGVRLVSSAFYMVLHPGTDSERVITFTDCAVVPYPGADDLCEIALAAAADRRVVVGDEPRVALLSFSTHGSAVGPSVSQVRAAVELIRQREPALVVDGDLQADAALVSSVAETKAPQSPVQGDANVLVFPSLDSGNIAYKLVQRLAGALAIGPILQGLAKPCADLSRGADPEDIINVASIAILKSASLARSKSA